MDDEGSSTTLVARQQMGVAQGTSRTSGRSPPCCNAVFAIAGAHGSFAWTQSQNESSKTGVHGQGGGNRRVSQTATTEMAFSHPALPILELFSWHPPPTPKCSRDPERAQMPSLEPSSSTLGQFLGKRSNQKTPLLLTRPLPTNPHTTPPPPLLHPPPSTPSPPPFSSPPPLPSTSLSLSPPPPPLSPPPLSRMDKSVPRNEVHGITNNRRVPIFYTAQDKRPATTNCCEPFSTTKLRVRTKMQWAGSTTQIPTRTP